MAALDRLTRGPLTSMRRPSTAALSLSVYAAAEADKTQAAEVQVAKPAVKKVKRHSHAEEKTGVPQQVPTAASSDENSDTLRIDKDRSRHYHPRDGK